jgi:enolase
MYVYEFQHKYIYIYIYTSGETEDVTIADLVSEMHTNAAIVLQTSYRT